MMMTLLTFAILGVSVLLVICGLRTLAQDTYQTIALATERARKAGALIPRASFATLWLMIFALSYM